MKTSNALSLGAKSLCVAATCLACASARAYVADVTKYGAKGDGVTDDTAAVQRAIDAVAAAGGGKVYLPFTTNGYLIASPGRETDAAGRPVRAQLVIPAGRATIAFEGEMPCKFLYEYQVRPKGCEKAGFTLGNDGRYKTCPAGMTNDAEQSYALDNVIVKGLDILEFKIFDRPDLSDHALVRARLRIPAKRD